MALGCGILFAAAITYFVLPVSLNEPDTTENSNKERVIDLLKVPSICIAVLSLFVASSSIGFLLSSLEPHMRQFGFSPLMMGKWNGGFKKKLSAYHRCEQEGNGPLYLRAIMLYLKFTALIHTPSPLFHPSSD